MYPKLLCYICFIYCYKFTQSLEMGNVLDDQRRSLSSREQKITIEDTINVQFRGSHGVNTFQMIDLVNEVEALKVVASRKRGRDRVVCYLSHLDNAHLITPFSLSLYKHKYPNIARAAGPDRAGLWHGSSVSAWAGSSLEKVSPAAARHCAAAKNMTYMRTADLQRWAVKRGANLSTLRALVTPFPATFRESLPSCDSMKDADKACMCNSKNCVEYLCPRTCHVQETTTVLPHVDYNYIDEDASRSHQSEGIVCDEKYCQVCQNKTNAFGSAVGCSTYICGIQFCRGKRSQRALGYICGSRECDRCVNKDCAKLLCELKYCMEPLNETTLRGGSSGDDSFCGMKTCTKCYDYTYQAENKKSCLPLWDDPSFAFDDGTAYYDSDACRCTESWHSLVLLCAVAVLHSNIF